ncbi:MAG: protein kinase [Labilithrix sp.]|nr:protein kinase [Labilithrix sp.]MCW5811686.1 protein kinase [Labilithrix sp.]
MQSPSDQQRQLSLRDSLVGRVLQGSGNVAYHIKDCIGEGGQGWVFRAGYGSPNGNVVIVKVLRPDVFATEALRRFQREAEVLRMLSAQGRPNPYIVRFFDHAVAQVPSPFGRDQVTLPFTVLEYVDGSTLEKVLTDQTKLKRGLSAERVRRLLRQICQALEVVHKQKVVHRDLKPSNILLAYDNGVEVAKVTDFGLVKLVDMNLQKTAALAGASLGYAPPEQYEQGNKRVSPRTDVFSLAAVVYEMLTTKPAFPFVDGENPLIIITRILNGPRPSLIKNRDRLAPELEASQPIVEALDRELSRALAADPTLRHESATALWNALEPPLRAALEDQKTAPRAAVSPYEATATPSRAPAEPGAAAVIRSANEDIALAPTDAQNALPKLPPQPPNAHENEAWTWALLTPPIGERVLRAVTFNKTADTAIALNAAGLVQWERGAWVSIPLPAHVPRNALRGLRWLTDGSVLLYGEGGFVARHVIGGGTAIWRVPDPEITFLGALIEANGHTTLVGERPYRGNQPRAFPGNTSGVVTQWSGDRVTVVGDTMSCSRLHAVTRMRNGTLIACGDWGALVRIELGVIEYVGSICGGHLLALAPRPEGGAYAVGVGGHALSLSPTLEPTLEAVQTTKDLLSIGVADDAQAWAGSAAARIVRRGTHDGAPTWMRISGDIGVTTNMLAIAAAARTVRAIGDDGMVVEGRLAPA